jgi:hypothetical protein
VTSAPTLTAQMHPPMVRRVEVYHGMLILDGDGGTTVRLALADVMAYAVNDAPPYARVITVWLAGAAPLTFRWLYDHLDGDLRPDDALAWAVTQRGKVE